MEQAGSVTFDGETIEGAPPLWCAAAAGISWVEASLLTWVSFTQSVTGVTFLKYEKEKFALNTGENALKFHLMAYKHIYLWKIKYISKVWGGGDKTAKYIPLGVTNNKCLLVQVI